jgi:hypothetical protein
MNSTETLIDRLAGDLQPVQPLRKPWLRACLWIAFASLLIVLLVAIRGFRADIAECVAEWSYWLPLIGAWTTGATAAFAAFAISLPDRPRAWLLLPVPSVLLWLTGFAWGCLKDWIEIPAGAPIAADSLSCMITILSATAGLVALLLPMLRRVKTLRPNVTAWLAFLAVAGFADTAHLLINVVQASLLVLVVNLVPMTLIILLGGLAGRRALAA